MSVGVREGACMCGLDCSIKQSKKHEIPGPGDHLTQIRENRKRKKASRILAPSGSEIDGRPEARDIWESEYADGCVVWKQRSKTSYNGRYIE